MVLGKEFINMEKKVKLDNNISSWTKLILDELSTSYQRQNFNTLNRKHKRN